MFALCSKTVCNHCTPHFFGVLPPQFWFIDELWIICIDSVLCWAVKKSIINLGSLEWSQPLAPSLKPEAQHRHLHARGLTQCFYGLPFSSVLSFLENPPKLYYYLSVKSFFPPSRKLCFAEVRSFPPPLENKTDATLKWPWGSAAHQEQFPSLLFSLPCLPECQQETPHSV